MKKVKISFLILAFFVLFGSSAIIGVFADTGCGTAVCPPTFFAISSVFQSILNVFIPVSVVVFFFMLLVGGFNFVTANGDPKKIDAGKKSLIFSVIGFALIFLPFVVIPTIINVTGVKSGIGVDKNGNISINISSTFTPTPLPSWLINTATPPTITPTGGLGGSGTEPKWWNGPCDAKYYKGASGVNSMQLASWVTGNGTEIDACGPAPELSGIDVGVAFFPGAHGEYEWECVELSMRYMYMIYGIDPYPANGNEVLIHYPQSNGGNKMQVVWNRGGVYPQVGDILAIGLLPRPGRGVGNGHTSIVIATNIQNGEGTITTLNQNIPVSGKPLPVYTIPVHYGIVMNDPYAGPVQGWLHYTGK